MAAFVPKVGGISGITIYINGVLVARDVAFNLPEVTPLTVELQAGGTFTMSMWELIENMEFTFTKSGIDDLYAKCVKPGMNNIEVRYTQPVIDAGGNSRTILNKAFMKGMPTTIPAVGGEIGSIAEPEHGFNVSRFQHIVDGVETHLIDKLAGIVNIGGKSFTDGLAGL